MNILVTGGAGYIGSHMVRVLLKAEHSVTIVDIDDATDPQGASAHCFDIVEYRNMLRLLVAQKIDAVMHFAGHIQVAESVKNPRGYYRDNVAAGISLLDACLDAGVKKFIFSSSAAVYGHSWHLVRGFEPEAMLTPNLPVSEKDPCEPTSPYGETKLIFENILRRYSDAYGLRSVSLRYFNAAGAADGLRERHDPETHLIPLAIDAALADKPVTIYGTDYPTPDGTAVRDYVHVVDLCEGHLAALRYLEAGGKTDVFNLGSGKGTSVREVIACVARATDRPGLTVKHEARRAGDPPALVASIEKAFRVLDWRPAVSSIDRIVHDALDSRDGRARGV